MNTVIVHPENKEKWDALKAFMKALKIKFELTTSQNADKPYDPEFLKKLDRGDKNVQEGKLKKVKLDDLWK